jgi:hypothetical protein
MSDPTTAPRREPWRWYALFLLPFVGTLWVPFYDSVEPTLGGFPFFYWYLFAWIVVAAGLSALVHRMTKQAP